MYPCILYLAAISTFIGKAPIITTRQVSLDTPVRAFETSFRIN